MWNNTKSLFRGVFLEKTKTYDVGGVFETYMQMYTNMCECPSPELWLPI